MGGGKRSMNVLAGQANINKPTASSSSCYKSMIMVTVNSDSKAKQYFHEGKT
jgi:hypothetical protein